MILYYGPPCDNTHPVLALRSAVLSGDQMAAADAALRMPSDVHPRNDLAMLVGYLWWVIWEMRLDAREPAEARLLDGLLDDTFDIFVRMVAGVESRMPSRRGDAGAARRG